MVSEIGIFFESNTVPVRGPNFLSQSGSRHSYTRIPVFLLNPSFRMRADLQCGQDPGTMELTKATSASLLSLCFSLNHSVMVSSARVLSSPDFAENAASAALGFFSFMFGGFARRGDGARNRQVSRRRQPVFGLLMPTPSDRRLHYISKGPFVPHVQIRVYT